MASLGYSYVNCRSFELQGKKSINNFYTEISTRKVDLYCSLSCQNASVKLLENSSKIGGMEKTTC